MSTDAGTGTSVVCSIVPMLSVRNGARAVEFYKSAFEAIEVCRVEDPAGRSAVRLRRRSPALVSDEDRAKLARWTKLPKTSNTLTPHVGFPGPEPPAHAPDG